MDFNEIKELVEQIKKLIKIKYEDYHISENDIDAIEINENEMPDSAYFKQHFTKYESYSCVYVFVDKKDKRCLKVGQAVSTHHARIWNHYKYNEKYKSRLCNFLINDNIVDIENVTDWMIGNLACYVIFVKKPSDDHKENIMLNFVEGYVQFFLYPKYEKRKLNNNEDKKLSLK